MLWRRARTDAQRTDLQSCHAVALSLIGEPRGVQATIFFIVTQAINTRARCLYFINFWWKSGPGSPRLGELVPNAEFSQGRLKPCCCGYVSWANSVQPALICAYAISPSGAPGQARGDSPGQFQFVSAHARLGDDALSLSSKAVERDLLEADSN